MKRAYFLGLLVVLVACQQDETGPRPAPAKSPLAVAAGEENDGPPTNYPPGSDTYRIGVLTGTGRHKLDCTPTASGGRVCEGFLRSDVDKTYLDVKLEIPPGTGPFPLIALIHGYGGSKNSSGDIASRLLEKGYAILRYSTRGFGESWGLVNLADLNAEIGDLRSMIGQVVDESQFNLNGDKVAVTGASYGGGHSWLALVQPTFETPKKNTVHIRAVVPIAPWTDLVYSLLPNGHPNNSVDGVGGLKLTYINGLYASGFREERPNYPDYLIAWHAYMNVSEPNSLDPVWKQIVAGLALGRSIWWQKTFWDAAVDNKIPIFQVQGFTDDLFPLPEAKRMLLAIKSRVPDYPITSYFGDLGHPRAHNYPDEVNYVLGLIEPWLAWYLKDEGAGAPRPVIYAARTDVPFNKDNPQVIQFDNWSQFSNGTYEGTWTADPLPRLLVNPATVVGGGIRWDPFVDYAGEPLHPYLTPPPESDVAVNSLFSYEFEPPTPLTVAGQPSVTLDAIVVGHRVQLNVRLLDVEGANRRLITRGTLTLDYGTGVSPAARQEIVIPTYGNFWYLPTGHKLVLELSNVDSPYITPSREPSQTTIFKATLTVPTLEPTASP